MDSSFCVVLNTMRRSTAKFCSLCPISRSVLILVHHHIQSPVQAVFHPTVLVRNLVEAFRVDSAIFGPQHFGNSGTLKNDQKGWKAPYATVGLVPEGGDVGYAETPRDRNSVEGGSWKGEVARLSGHLCDL